MSHTRVVLVGVVWSAYDSHDRPALRVARKQHGARTDATGFPSAGDDGPTQSIVVLCV